MAVKVSLTSIFSTAVMRLGNNFILTPSFVDPIPAEGTSHERSTMFSQLTTSSTAPVLLLFCCCCCGVPLWYVHDVVQRRQQPIPTIIITDVVRNGEDKVTCRTGIIREPHQSTLWNMGFPNEDTNLEALCEGSVQVDEDTGDICVTGRMSYAQIEEALGKPIRQPSAKSISLSGHLVSGIPNVVLGTEGRYLYDFVKSYKIEGTSTVTNPVRDRMTEDFVAASNGIIEEVCLDSSFAKEEELYSISHGLFIPPATAVEEKYTDASVIFVSSFAIVTEYHKPVDFSIPIYGTLSSMLFGVVVNLLPSWVYNIFPPLIGLTGILRLFVFGTTSTATVPQPLIVDIAVDDVQIDTEWTTLMAAMADGLFTKNVVPPYIGIAFKRLSAGPSSNSCWQEDTAAIDLQVAPGYGPKLDEYIDQELLPALVKAGGTTSSKGVSLHLGKRLVSDSDILAASWDFYEQECFVNLDLDIPPDNCYHPACTRSSTLTTFKYPPDLYQEGKK